MEIPSDQTRAPKPSNDPTSLKGHTVPRPKRRKKSKAEKDAAYQKKLRDTYGQSRFDPEEPSLAELSCAAISCAIDLAKRAWRRDKAFKPQHLVDQTAQICGLAAGQKQALLEWVRWLKDRRWVLTELQRSPAVEWVQSKPPKDAIWTDEIAAQWRADIEGSTSSNDVVGVPTSPAQPSGQPTAAIHSGAADHAPSAEAAERPHPVLDNRPVEQASHGGSTRDDTSRRTSSLDPADDLLNLAAQTEPNSSPSSPASAIVSIDQSKIPALPYGAFMKGQQAGNTFAGAADRYIKGSGSADELSKAAVAFSKDVAACREFCGRSPGHRKFLESIFNQLGLEIP